VKADVLYGLRFWQACFSFQNKAFSPRLQEMHLLWVCSRGGVKVPTGGIQKGLKAFLSARERIAKAPYQVQRQWSADLVRFQSRRLQSG